MRRIVIVGAPPVQILDVAGPLEVFSSVPKYRVELGTPDGSGVLWSSRGVAFTNAIPIEDLSGPIDTLVIVGGPGAESGTYDQRFLAWIGEAAERSRRIASICTGAFLLAATGLLNGKEAVTHWKCCNRLAREYPAVRVRSDPIYVRRGNIYTSAGITAGIDLMLALVEQDCGREVALNVARNLVMFVVRPGCQAQYSNMLSRQAVNSHSLRELQVWLLEHLHEDLSVERLAERMAMSARHFTRVCLRETGMNPGQVIDLMRVEAAQQMIVGSALGLKQIADECGFRSADRMRRTFLRLVGITAGEYAARFKRPVARSGKG
jgi:transcriptional regulator GlxA family with amidase domain